MSYHSSGHSRHESDSRHKERERPIFCTYRDNLFNDYVGKRVQLTMKHRLGRMHVYIGTFMAFDFDLNVVLADCYRVIMHHQERQRQDVKGLLMIRGCHVVSVKRERDEKRLKRYPTLPDGSKKKAKGARHRSKSSGSVARTPASTPASTPQSTPSRPLKLKRTWRTATPEPTPASSPKLPRTPQNPQSPGRQDTPSGANDVVSDMVRDLKIKEEPGEEEARTEEETVVKEEPEEKQIDDCCADVPAVKEEHMTFEEFLNTSDLQEESSSEGEI